MMKTCAVLLLISSITLADYNPIFPAIVEPSSIQQAAYNGGGSAMSDKVNGATLNPATLFSYHKLHGKRLGVIGSYQNARNGRILANTGVSFAPNQQNVLGLDYSQRDSREGLASKIHRGAITYSSLVREESKEGFMSWGVNLTYYNSNGEYSTESKLPITINDSIIYYESGLTSLSGTNQTLNLDLGIYQFDKQKGLSYGIVFENIVGYDWKERSNSLVTTHDTFSIPPSITPLSRDSVKYSGVEIKENGWINGTTKSLLIGLAVNRQILNYKVVLTIPFDVRFWGFMDKNLRKNSEWKDRCMMYTGSELNFGGALSLRGGYSWTPNEYFTDINGNPVFRNHHHASGGFRISLNVVDIEMAFRKQDIGGGVSVYF